MNRPGQRQKPRVRPEILIKEQQIKAIDPDISHDIISDPSLFFLPAGEKSPDFMMPVRKMRQNETFGTARDL